MLVAAFGGILLIGAILYMMLNGAMNDLFAMGYAVTDNADSTTGLDYLKQGWMAFPLIVLGLFVFYLLVGAVYSSDVGGGM